MHIAAYTMATEKTIPALGRLRDAAERNAKRRTDPYVSGQPETHIAVDLVWSSRAASGAHVNAYVADRRARAAPT